jgi:PhoPQ-activated pathogenicity-related protein
VEIGGVSQVWKDIPWRHDVVLVVPDGRRHTDLALLSVVADAGDTADARRIARRAGVTVAVVGGVPNQPLLGGRFEDDLVAETFARYLSTGDGEWPLLLPMTKAATWAMNVVQTVDPDVQRFVVSGASKRGWTTWLAGAFDARVAGIVPLVFDNLRFDAQLRNQMEVWGRYSPMIGDYTGRGLARATDTPRGRALAEDVDPWSHRNRLVRPRKLLVHGTNDPYWALDAIRLYWNDLGGEKSVLYVPNGGHGIAGSSSVVAATAAFVARVASSRPMPTLTAARVDATVHVSVSEPARAVRVWRAESSSRDFRDARWASVPGNRAADAWTIDLPRHEGGFVAYFADATFTEGDGEFSLATPVDLVGPR